MRTGGTPSKQSIIELLACNDKAVGRAVVALWKRQTEDERQARTTKHENGRGFNQADGGPGCSDAALFAEQGWLPVTIVEFWRAPQGNTTRIGKYAGQLLEIALERWAEKQLQLGERV